MRFLKVAGAVLLLVAMVNSLPTEEEKVSLQDTDGDGDDGDLEDLESIIQNIEKDNEADAEAVNDVTAEGDGEEDGDDEGSDDSHKDNVNSEEEGQEEVEAQRKGDYISQGNTIALQTYVRNHYMGCPGGTCGRKGCPYMDMSGNDWSRCWGEVFRIYRRKGPGVVRSGDIVGIYYPRESGRWLGCAGGNCRKATCPGQPTMRHGFRNAGVWGPCWGEVFRIFAKGKRLGTPIRRFDDVSLLLTRKRSWLSQCHGGHTKLRSCLGRSLPPSLSKFDRCACETFKIYKNMRKC